MSSLSAARFMLHRFRGRFVPFHRSIDTQLFHDKVDHTLWLAWQAHGKEMFSTRQRLFWTRYLEWSWNISRPNQRTWNTRSTWISPFEHAQDRSQSSRRRSRTGSFTSTSNPAWTSHPIELLQVPSPNCFTWEKEKRIAQDEGGDANQNEAILPYENSIEPPSSRAAFLDGLGTEDPQIAVVEAMATGGEATQIADTAGTGCSLWA